MYWQVNNWEDVAGNVKTKKDAGILRILNKAIKNIQISIFYFKITNQADIVDKKVHN